MVKFVLWAGPEDGKEIEVSSQEQQYVLDSPSDTETRAQMLGVKAPDAVPKRKACYRYNRDTKRFEWKGYL